MRPLDWAAASVAGAAFLWLARRRTCAPTARSAFLADNELSWPSAAAAMLAAEVSTLTLAGLPAAVFGGVWGWALFFTGNLSGRAAYWALAPRLRVGAPLTVYSWLGERLGPGAGKASAALFFAGRTGASCLRLAAGAAALEAVSGMQAALWAPALAAAAAYTAARGGLRAVVDTAWLQAGAFFAWTAFVAGYLAMQTGGGPLAAWRLAWETGIPAAGPVPLWPACLYGFAGALAAFAADHEQAQKILACRSDADARRAVLAAAAGGTLLALGLAALGLCLRSFYSTHPALAVPGALEVLLPHFASTVMPVPLRGLTCAALALAVVDLPISSLTAAYWSGFVGGDELGPKRRAVLSAGAALALTGGAYWLLGAPTDAGPAEALWPAAAGPLLGAVLAAAAPQAAHRPNTIPSYSPGWALAGFAAGATASAALFAAYFSGMLPIVPTWLTPIGALLTFLFVRGLSRDARTPGS